MITASEVVQRKPGAVHGLVCPVGGDLGGAFLTGTSQLPQNAIDSPFPPLYRTSLSGGA